MNSCTAATPRAGSGSPGSLQRPSSVPSSSIAAGSCPFRACGERAANSRTDEGLSALVSGPTEATPEHYARTAARCNPCEDSRMGRLDEADLSLKLSKEESEKRLSKLQQRLL